MLAVLPVLVSRMTPGPALTKVALAPPLDRMMPASRSMPDGAVPAATVMVIGLAVSFWMRDRPELIPIHWAVVAAALVVMPGEPVTWIQVNGVFVKSTAPPVMVSALV